MSAVQVPVALACLVLLLLFPPLFSNVALGHGSPPGSCGNEYSYQLVSMTVDNGSNTYDLFEDPGITFNGNNDPGYDVTFTIHAANQSVAGNTEEGSIWYRTIAYGFGQGVCVYGMAPDQDKTVVVENIVPAQQTNKDSADGGGDDLQYVEWNFMFSGPDARTITYEVSWYSPSNYPSDNTGTFTVTIEAIDWNNTDFANNRINGMYFNLTQGGELVDEGFNPVTFTLNNGEEYQIGAADYGKDHFRNWGDAYEYDAIRTIETQDSTDLVLYAYYYDRGQDDDPPEALEDEQPPDDKDPAPPDAPDSDDGRSDEDDDEDSQETTPAGTVISPFIFDNNNDNDTTPAPETDGSEQMLENVDVLDINGTLTSFHFTKDMRLYILSGNWSMSMNGTAVIDFGANFTMVKADGLDRQTFSFNNLTAVSDSDLILGNDTLALTSALDYRANGTVTRVNATVTLEKLNVVKIETDDMGPIYGVVDKVVRNINGEKQVMARQFDMI